MLRGRTRDLCMESSSGADRMFLGITIFGQREGKSIIKHAMRCLCSIKEAILLVKCEVGVKKICSMTSGVNVMNGHGLSIVIMHLVYLLSAAHLHP